MIFLVIGWFLLGFIAVVVLNSYWIGRFPMNEHRGAFIAGYLLIVAGPMMFIATAISLALIKKMDGGKIFYPIRFWIN